MSVSDFASRDSQAKKFLDHILGHTAASIEPPIVPQRIDGWLYWSPSALVFLAKVNLPHGRQDLILEFKDIINTRSKYSWMNGLLRFEVSSSNIEVVMIFAGQKKHMTALEMALLKYKSQNSD